MDLWEILNGHDDFFTFLFPVKITGMLITFFLGGGDNLNTTTITLFNIVFGSGML